MRATRGNRAETADDDESVQEIEVEPRIIVLN